MSQLLLIILLLLPTSVWAAVDSYSFLHVTIETPWAIFIFLLFFVMSPFVLLAILYWHGLMRKPDKSEKSDQE